MGNRELLVQREGWDGGRPEELQEDWGHSGGTAGLGWAGEVSGALGCHPRESLLSSTGVPQWGVPAGESLVGV